MKKAAIIFLLALALHLPGLAHAQVQSPQATLTQHIADLKKNPGDYALRERIIRHVQAMKQKPAIPEEAERRMARGSAAVKGAQNKQDFRDAAAEFEKASLAAPWLPAIYYNLGITQDKAGNYKEAIQSLKLYLLAAPDAPDAKAVKNLVYEIEYRQEKAAKESSPEAVAKQEQDKSVAFLRNLNGTDFTADLDLGCYGERHTVTIRGDVFIFRSRCYRSTCPDQKHTRVGHEDAPWSGKIRIIGLGHFSVASIMPWQCKEFKVSDDGSKMWLFSGNNRPFKNNPFYRAH